MPPASSLRSVTVRPLDIPLFEPFGISGGAQALAANVLVLVELADGTVGHGEAAPLPPYNGETQADALRALRSASAWLQGRDAASWPALGRAFAARARPRSGSARCALETALVDALARQAGVSLTAFLAAAVPAATRRPAVRLETDMTVTTGTPAAATAAVRRIQRRGIRVIKVKIGGAGGPAHDLARLLAIRAVAPRAPLVLDGNAGLSRTDAFLLVRLLQAARITPAVLEQWLPKDDLAGMRRLRRESGWLVAADEAVTS
ncbi:MAG: enolase C-terminal domain-like protein, partial [Opitutaceae bacterium]